MSRRGRFPVRHLLLGLLLVGGFARANINKILLIDAGIGFPQLAGIQATIYATRRFQLGMSAGFLPGGQNLFPSVSLPAQQLTLADGNSYTYAPKASAMWYSLCPFVRFFPTERPYYLQFAWDLFVARATIKGPITASGGTELDGASITGTVDLIQAIPTISLGHIFHSRLFFVNFALGVSFFSNLSTRASVSGTFPDAVGGQEVNTSKLEGVETELSAAASGAANSGGTTSQFPILPSLWLSVGFLI